jgi:hypothetical protein
MRHGEFDASLGAAQALQYGRVARYGAIPEDLVGSIPNDGGILGWLHIQVTGWATHPSSRHNRNTGGALIRFSSPCAASNVDEPGLDLRGA